MVTYQVAKLRNFTFVCRVGCGVGGRTSLPPYKLCGPISSLVFNKSLSNLTSLLIPARPFFQPCWRTFADCWSYQKLKKPWKDLFTLYCASSWGLKLRGNVLKSFLSKECTSLQDRTRACADLLYCLVRRAYVLVKTYQKKLSYLQSIKGNIAKCTPAKDPKALTQSQHFPLL